MAQNVVAPLAGIVLRINVSKGDKVAEDDEIIVIEAMKMETMVYASCSGTIQEIKVKEGQSVEEEDVLLSIEED
jgi:biotin carboxyl carrier protein